MADSLFTSTFVESETTEHRPETLWQRLEANRDDQDAFELLIQRYKHLIRSELRRAHARFPRHISMDELEMAGMEGLFLAVTAFDRSYGVEFENYARRRIRGSMLDRVRSLDGVPRTARKACRTLSQAQQQFLQKNGRTPSVEELAAEAGVAPEEISGLERQALSASRVSVDAMWASDGDEDSGGAVLEANLPAARDEGPLARLALAELKEQLVCGLKELSERERSILVLYYYEGVMFNEIAAAMGVSESRVSQLHSRALERLKRSITCQRIEKPADGTDEEQDTDEE